MRILFLLCIAAAAAPAQVVSVGVKAGVPVTAAVPGRYDDATGMLDTGRWTVGPTVEVRVFRALSFEADALYRGYRTQQTLLFPAGTIGGGGTYPAMASLYRTDTKVWDFPLMLKYRFGQKNWKPFVTAGFAWSHATSDGTSALICMAGTEACNQSDLKPFYNTFRQTTTNNDSSGPVAGAGVEFKLGRFKLAPELRYWRSTNPTSNRVTVLFGFTY